MRPRTLAVISLVASVVPGVVQAQEGFTAIRVGEHPSGLPGLSIRHYGQANGIAAYSFATTVCNPYNTEIPWSSLGNDEHPVLTQNFYQLAGRRFVQLGQLWTAHMPCSICDGTCGLVSGGCAPVLRSVCSDSLSAEYNDGSFGGPKFMVDPAGGDHIHPDPTPTGNALLRGRLQVPVSALTPSNNPGARYWAEASYISEFEHQLGGAKDNVCWLEVTVNAQLDLTAIGPQGAGESGVYAWKSADPVVKIVEVTNQDEGGSGVHGYMQVASRVWDNGDGTYDYSYVVNNQNSTQGISSFSVPSGAGSGVWNIWFNDVDYHSGELQNGLDWRFLQGSSSIEWRCQESFTGNPNANAINWATAYSFGFTSDVGPLASTGLLEMFEPGVGNVLAVPLDGPGAGSALGTSFCYGDGSDADCPCPSQVPQGAGCVGSSGRGARLVGSGLASVANDTAVLTVHTATPGVVGLFFGGNALANGGQGVVFGDGLRCAGGQLRRLQVRVTDGLGSASTSVGVSAVDGAQAGDRRYYQFWFRDPTIGCALPFNVSSALSVDWTQ